jgi:hypothetical protein
MEGKVKPARKTPRQYGWEVGEESRKKKETKKPAAKKRSRE